MKKQNNNVKLNKKDNRIKNDLSVPDKQLIGLLMVFIILFIINWIFAVIFFTFIMLVLAFSDTKKKEEIKNVLSGVFVMAFICGSLINYSIQIFHFAGGGKTAQLCSESLKQTPYARDININNGSIEFYVDYNFTLEHGPSTSNLEWGNQGDVMWNWVNRYVSSDVMARCKGPVNVNYTYIYVKKIYRNGLVIPETHK